MARRVKNYFPRDATFNFSLRAKESTERILGACIRKHLFIEHAWPFRISPLPEMSRILVGTPPAISRGNGESSASERRSFPFLNRFCAG